MDKRQPHVMIHKKQVKEKKGKVTEPKKFHDNLARILKKKSVKRTKQNQT